MADQNTLLASLKSIFPESSWSWAISALRQDGIIWNSLKDPDFFSQVSARSVEPREWSPHRLALDFLGASQISDLDQALGDQAQAELSQYLKNGIYASEGALDFKSPALIGLGMFQCYTAGDWTEIREALGSSPLQQNGWLTPTAVMLGFIEDQPVFLRDLISEHSAVNTHTILLHAVLSQPRPPGETRQLLKKLLVGLDLRRAADLLEQLSSQKPELSMLLANDWLGEHPLESDSSLSSSLSSQLQRLADDLLAAQILSLAGQLGDAGKRKSLSLNSLKDLQVEVSNRIVGESLRESNIEYSLSKWTQTSVAPKWTPPAGLVIELLKANRLEDVLSLLPETEGNTQTPLRWLVNIYQALENGDLPQARLFGHQALKSFTALYQRDKADVARVFGTRRDLQHFTSELVDRLADLALFKEAFQAAQIAAEIDPDDSQVLLTLTKTARSAGEHAQSIAAAQLAAALMPTHPEFRRQLARSLESAGDWQAALPERQVVLEHRFAQPGETPWPTTEDMLSFASCALQAGEPGEANEVCQKAVDQEPSDGQAHAILGETLSALGQDQQAMEHFRLATQLAPHKAGPWLSLANAFQKIGQVEKSIETLRTASHAVPDDPSIFFTLGKVHIDEGSPSQAQPALERAYQLVSEPYNFRSRTRSQKSGATRAELFARNRAQLCEIALAYGAILEQLGHQEQAYQVIETAYHAYPAYPGLAYTYAKSIMETGEETSALAPLAIAVSANPTEPQPYIDYARMLLRVGENPQEAVQALQRALELLEDQPRGSDQEPLSNHYVALGLLAQAQEASGEYLQSLQTYSQALETPLARDEGWQMTLSVGMGRVAIQLDQPEIAIAALQDSNQREIQNTEIAQILCLAYSAINLNQEALFAARSAVHLAPDNVDILAWFADQAVDLGVIAEAIPALTSAVQLDPQRTDLVIRLAGIQASMGKNKAARETFLSALSSPYSSPEDLYQAAEGLGGLGEKESAAACLERALEMQPQPPLDRIIELAAAYRSAGNTELAITTIEKGIDHYAEHAPLHAYKADLLSISGRLQAARSCLEHALILDPEDASINLQMAFVLRDQQDLHTALSHVRRALDHFSDGHQSRAAQGLAAELARSTLQEAPLDLLLNAPPAQDLQAPGIALPFTPSLLEYHCICAETYLDREEQIAAAAALNEAFTLSADHPRVLALQVRMGIRQGDRDAAQETFMSILDQLQAEETHGYSSSTLLGIALAAQELYLWEQAASILEGAAASYPKQSNLQLQIARLFVIRAEFQRLCQALDITTHAPGGNVLSPRTQRLFEEAIQRTYDSLSSDQQAEPPQVIQRWVNRGRLAFQPSEQVLQDSEQLPENPSDQAALLTALTQGGDADLVSRTYHAIQSQSGVETLHHSIYAAYAFALYQLGQDLVSSEQASQAILAAIDQQPAHAVYHVIQAKLAEQAGNWQMAEAAMQTALSLWNDEPRWHASLASILLLNDQFPEAVAHLISSLEMEPTYLDNYLDLSQAYLRNGEPSSALEILKDAIHKFPDQVEPLLALANASYETQQYTQASRYADKALKIAPGEIDPLLVSARIALKLGDPVSARTKTELALQKSPGEPAAMELQVQALAAAGDISGALQFVEQSIPLASNQLPLQILRANLLVRSEGHRDLLSELKSIADQHPDQALVLAPLARAYAENGEITQAIQTAQQALRQNNNQLPLDEQAHLHQLLGQMLRQSGQLDQSVFHLSEAIRIAPQSLTAYLELGLTQQERRQYDLALETYKKAMRSYPADPRPYFQAGQLLKASRDYPAAESMLRKAAERSPDDLTIHRQLAAIVAINLVHNRQPVRSEVNSV